MTTLALHGHGQCGAWLLPKLARLGLKEDIVAPNAPHVLVDGESYTWWEVKLSPGESIRQFLTTKRSYVGYNESVAHLRTQIDFNDVQILVGFSQGAIMATIMAHQGLFPRLRCIILISPSPIMDPELQGKHKITIPTLAILGNQDDVVEPGQSLKVAHDYANFQMHFHKGRHVIPSESSVKKAFQSFILASIEGL